MSVSFRVVKYNNLRPSSPFEIIGVDNLLFNNADQPIIVFYNWVESFTVSLNQTVNDLNVELLNKENVPFVRVLTGGRAVYHHPGGLTYSLFVPVNSFKELYGVNPFRRVETYNLFCGFIGEALNELGVGRVVLLNHNDLYVDGKKLSGNAQRITNKVVLQQGIVLYDKPRAERIISFMNPSLYDEGDVRRLDSVLTSVKEHCNTGLNDLVIKISELFSNDNYFFDGFSVSEVEEVERLVVRRNAEDDLNKEYSSRGLCWLPEKKGLPVKGSFVGENPR